MTEKIAQGGVVPPAPRGVRAPLAKGEAVIPLGRAEAGEARRAYLASLEQELEACRAAGKTARVKAIEAEIKAHRGAPIDATASPKRTTRADGVDDQL